MIQSAVEKIANSFAKEWSIGSSLSPTLVLDGTWPSVGLLDQALFGLRGLNELFPFDEDMIRGASAYLAIKAEKCWTAFGASSEVTLGDRGIEIRAISGPHLSEGRQYLVRIEETLRNILMQDPEVLPIIGSAERIIPTGHNIVSLFAIGLLTGLSPFGEGPWRQIAPNDWSEHTEEVLKVLATESADYYARVFPDEPIGQVAEIYLHGLIFPPLLLDEPEPAFRASQGLISAFKEYGFSLEQTRTFLENITRSPDELISHAGLVFTCAVFDELPCPEVIEVSQQMGIYMGALRKAVSHVRTHYNSETDWLYQEAFNHEHFKRYKFEQRMGLIPWSKLSPEDIASHQLLPIVRALASFDFEQSLTLIDNRLSETPGLIPLRVQRIYLEMIRGEFEQADAMFKQLLSEPGADSSSMLFNLWGLVKLSIGESEAAVRYMEVAFEIFIKESSNEDVIEKAEFVNNYAWCLIRAGDFDKASYVLSKSLESDFPSATSLLNQSFIMRQTGRESEAKESDLEALKLAPMDRRTYGNVLTTTLRERGIIDVPE